MSHEIEKNDRVVLHKEQAWHGLGIVVDEAPTPREALKLAELDWECEQWPLSATNGETRVILDKHQANIRSDTKDLLGVVGKDWTPFQNYEMADFCEALAEQNDQVKLESAGSIRNGQKVWMLMKASSFEIKRDVIEEYILASNGFDGGTSFRCTPTSIRVVCSNTLHAVIPNWDSESGKMRSLKQQAFVCKHTGNLPDRIEEAKQALELYGRSVEQQRQMITAIAGVDVNSERVKQFFLESYTKDFGGIPDEDDMTKKESRKREKALKAFQAYEKRFDTESVELGANAWTMFNAYSGYVQHDREVRLKDATARLERKLNSNLFGTAADKTMEAFGRVLTLAV